MKTPKITRVKPADFLPALVRTGYLPQEAPPAITTKYFSNFCRKQYAFLNSQKGALLKLDTQYETYACPRPKSGRRNFAIVHRLGQLAVSIAITQHRAEIKKLISQNGVLA
jgi:hypothetical protein